MIIFDARNVRANKARPLFNVALGELLFLTQFAEPITNNHHGIIPFSSMQSKGSIPSRSECHEEGRAILWAGNSSCTTTSCLSVPGTYDFHVSLDVRILSKPCFISNQDARALTTNEQPQTMHVSELLKQTKDGRDVVRIRGSHIVVSLADQFFTLVPNKLAETIGNFDVLPVAVYHRNVLRLHFKLRGLQLLAKCFNNTPRPFGILCLGFVANNARWGIGLSFWHVLGYLRSWPKDT